MNISLDETLLDGVNERLDRIEAKLAVLAFGEALHDQIQEEAMSDFSLRVDALASEVSENRSAVDSARTVITGLRTDIQTVRDELARRGVSDQDLAALDALTSSLDSNTNDLAEAVAENTDAEADGTGQPAETPTDTTPTGDQNPGGAPAPGEPTDAVGGVDSVPMGGATGDATFDSTAPDV